MYEKLKTFNYLRYISLVGTFWHPPCIIYFSSLEGATLYWGRGTFSPSPILRALLNTVNRCLFFLGKLFSIQLSALVLKYVVGLKMLRHSEYLVIAVHLAITLIFATAYRQTFAYTQYNLIVGGPRFV